MYRKKGNCLDMNSSLNNNIKKKVLLINFHNYRSAKIKIYIFFLKCVLARMMEQKLIIELELVVRLMFNEFPSNKTKLEPINLVFLREKHSSCQYVVLI